MHCAMASVYAYGMHAAIHHDMAGSPAACGLRTVHANFKLALAVNSAAAACGLRADQSMYKHLTCPPRAAAAWCRVCVPLHTRLLLLLRP